MFSLRISSAVFLLTFLVTSRAMLRPEDIALDVSCGDHEEIKAKEAKLETPDRRTIGCLLLNDPSAPGRTGKLEIKWLDQKDEDQSSIVPKPEETDLLQKVFAFHTLHREKVDEDRPSVELRRKIPQHRFDKAKHDSLAAAQAMQGRLKMRGPIANLLTLAEQGEFEIPFKSSDLQELRFGSTLSEQALEYNAMIGSNWYLGMEREPETGCWPCGRCTFFNEDFAQICVACDSPWQAELMVQAYVDANKALWNLASRTEGQGYGSEFVRHLCERGLVDRLLVDKCLEETEHTLDFDSEDSLPAECASCRRHERLMSFYKRLGFEELDESSSSIPPVLTFGEHNQYHATLRPQKGDTLERWEISAPIVKS